MAQKQKEKQKEGFFFFPVHTKLQKDTKILLAKQLVDPKCLEPWTRAILPWVAVQLLQEIYEVGYFVHWTEEIALEKNAYMDDVITYEMMQRIIKALIQAGFFDKDIFETYNILTSRGIQKRWLLISKNAKRKNIKIDPKLNLIVAVQEEMPLLTEEMAKIPELLPQHHPFPNKQTEITSNVRETMVSVKNTQHTVQEEMPLLTEEMAKIPELLPFPHVETRFPLTTTISNSISNIEDNVSKYTSSCCSDEFPEKTSFITEEMAKVQEVIAVVTEEKPKLTVKTQKTPEKPLKTDDTFDEKAVYRGSWHNAMPTSLCLEFFMTDPEFANDRAFVFEAMKYQLLDLPDEEVYERMATWGKVLNCHFDGEHPRRTMRGRDCWTQLFRNWIKKQNMQDDPIKKLHGIRTKSKPGEQKVSHIATDKMSIEEQKEHFKLKKRL